MKDLVGQELNIGDKVIITIGSSYLRIKYIEKFGELWGRPIAYVNGMKTGLRELQIYKM